MRVCPATCSELEHELGNAGMIARGGAELILRWAANGHDRDGAPVVLSPRAESMLRGVAAAGRRVQVVHRGLTPCPRGLCPQHEPAGPWWRRWWTPARRPCPQGCPP